MFYIKSTNKGYQKVLDSSNRVAGFVVNGKFVKNTIDEKCDPSYISGFLPSELEQISECMQRSKPPK